MLVKCKYLHIISIYEYLKGYIFWFNFVRIYLVHDELRNKDFHFEMSLVSKETKGLHRLNPQPWYDQAVQSGLAAKNEDDSDNEI